MFSSKKSIIRREKYVFLPPRQWELVTVTLACIRQAPVSHVQVKMKVVSPMSPDPALGGLVTWLQWSETDDNWLMNWWYSPSLSLIPTTMVSVVPRGTMPATGSAQGPLPCWISIQQSTLSPETCKSWELNKWANLQSHPKSKQAEESLKVIWNWLVLANFNIWIFMCTCE